MSSKAKHKQKKQQERKDKAARIRARNRRERQIKDARMKAAKKTGGLVKSVDQAIHLAYQQTLIEQRVAFKAKFGREVEPEDPIFFNPEEDEPVSLPRAKIKEHLASKGRLDVYRKLAEAWEKAEREIAEKTARIRKAHREERAKKSLEKLHEKEESVHVDASEG